MFRVTFDYPYVPGLGQQPSYDEVFYDQAEAEAFTADATKNGMLNAYCHEMSENECYNFNVGVHCPNGY